MATDRINIPEQMVGRYQDEEIGNLSHQLLDQEQITETIQYFVSCDTGILKNEDTLLHLSCLELVADNGGWSPAQLGLLVQQITTVPCPAQLTRRFLYSLVPSETVPARMLVQLALWGLGDSSFSRDCVILPTLKLIVLCLQYDCVTDKQDLVSMYELFMSLLSRDKLTNTVAELLQFLTTKKDVTEWRVRTILRCQAKLGSSYPLDSLVWRFRQFRPDLMPNCLAPAARASTASTVLSKRFHKVWEDRVDRSLEMSTREGVWFGGPQAGNTFKKGKRDNLVPSREVLSVVNGARARKEKRVDLAEMKTVKGVVDNIHNVQLPANILALLGCKASVQILAVDKSLVERFSMTLFHTLRNEFVCCEVKAGARDEARRLKRREKLLAHLVLLQEAVQQGLPVVGRFLSEYLDSWDGSSHFLSVLRLVSQLQITDYKELHDCVVSPLTRHFTGYNMVKQLVMLGFLHTLLRTWGAVEYERFTKHRPAIFPINTVHCENALEAISGLATEVGELSMLALSLARERGESTNLLTSQVMSMYRCSQLVMLEYSVPLKIEMPTVYLYSALFSHSAEQMAQACHHVLLYKKKVFPALNQAMRSLELVGGYDSLDISLVANMISSEAREELLVATRDMLVFLSPGDVHLTMGSILRQGWSLPLGEDWLREGLYLSSHPALLPYVLEYLDSLKLNTKDKQLAWLQLSEEQEDQQQWETNIRLGMAGNTAFNSKQFYNQSKSRESLPPTKTSKVRLGNIMDFLDHLSVHLPPIKQLVMEYKQKAGGSTTGRGRSKDTDARSVCSQETMDSGVESLHPRKKGRVSSQDTDELVQRKRSLEQVPRQERQYSLQNSSLHRQESSSSLQQNLSTLLSQQGRKTSSREVSQSSSAKRIEDESENKRLGNRKRKSVESIATANKRGSGEGRSRKAVLREKN